MCPPFPQSLPESLVGGACTGQSNDELSFLMVEQSRKTAQYSHKVHPGKWKVDLFIETCR